MYTYDMTGIRLLPFRNPFGNYTLKVMEYICLRDIGIVLMGIRHRLDHLELWNHKCVGRWYMNEVEN